MGENKCEVVNALFYALKETAYFHDLEKLEYKKREDGEEVVIATFDNGFTKTACVTADSGITIIKDCIEQLV